MNNFTAKVLMVRPSCFEYNAQTAVNNRFQQLKGASKKKSIKTAAIKEFEGLVSALEQAGVECVVWDEKYDSAVPDAVFPNNWFSTHQCGKIVLYPMFAENRRQERRPALLQKLIPNAEVIDLTSAEKQHQFLEGTGSIVLDRENRIAFCARSPRSHPGVFEKFCEALNYKAQHFSTQYDGQEIYHTNVMMGIGNGFAIACLDAIPNIGEKMKLKITLCNSRELIEISLEQMKAFAGNVLQLQQGLVLSETAFNSFSKEQILKIESFTKIIKAPLNTIETYGGGSARCMLAEVFEKS